MGKFEQGEDLHKLGKSLGVMFEKLRIPRSPVQTTVSMLLVCVTTLTKSGKRIKLSPSDEKKLVRLFRNNPGTTKAKAWHEMETAGTPAAKLATLTKDVFGGVQVRLQT